MKKILLLTENFPPKEGGSGRWFWELYSRLPRESVIVVANDSAEGRLFDESHDLNIIRFELESTEWGVASSKGIRFYTNTILAIRKLIKQHNVKEVHCGRVIPEGIVARVLKLLSGTEYRCFVHGEDVETAATSREHSLLVRNVCKNAKTLICNSENSAGLVEKLEFETKQKCEVLHPGADVARFTPAPPNDAFRQKVGWYGKRVLLTVGRLQRRKGQDFLVKIMPKLLKEFPDLFYAVVGRGELHEELTEVIEKNNLHDSVGIYSDMNDDELIQCYQQCDIFILPNRTIGNDIEGFGMVLVEAQICGKPVIAGDSGGTRETMDIGETGFVINCSSQRAMYEELVTLLRKPSFANESKNIASYARERFNWEAHVSKAKLIFGR